MVDHGGIIDAAVDALDRADCEEGCDPRLIILELAYLPRLETAPKPYRAIVEGRVISYAWAPDEHDWGLNAFHGLALAVLAEYGFPASPANVTRAVGHLALHRRGGDAVIAHRFLPHAFVRAHLNEIANNRSGVHDARQGTGR